MLFSQILQCSNDNKICLNAHLRDTVIQTGQTHRGCLNAYLRPTVIQTGKTHGGCLNAYLFYALFTQILTPHMHFLDCDA